MKTVCVLKLEIQNRTKMACVVVRWWPVLPNWSVFGCIVKDKTGLGRWTGFAEEEEEESLCVSYFTLNM